MVAVGEVSAAISGIKGAIELVKGMVGLKSSTEINLAVIEIQNALLTAQSAAFEDRERQSSQQARIAELESKLSEIDRWETEKARYRLTQTETGALIYSLKQEAANDEPHHSLCVKCFDEDRKSVLQVVRRHGGGERVECLHCQKKIDLTPFPPVQIERGHRSSSWMA